MLTAIVACHFEPVANAEGVSISNSISVFSALVEKAENVGLAEAKLAIDRTVQSDLDLDTVRAMLAQIELEIRASLGRGASEREKLAALRKYLYDPGPWNKNKIFLYDDEDPRGANVKNKLLTNYLSSHRGNCVTMPTLFLILAEKLGIKLSAALAPSHLFVIYQDAETGQKFNLETTSGAHVTRDEWYRQNLPMTDLAIESGLYMTPLTRKQLIAVFMEVTLAKALDQGEFEGAIRIADEILNVFPTFAEVIVLKGSAYGHLLEIEFQNRYLNPAEVPSTLRQRFSLLSNGNQLAFALAEYLGWKQLPN